MRSDYAMTEREVRALCHLVGNLPKFQRDVGFDAKYAEFFSSRLRSPSIVSHRLKLGQRFFPQVIDDLTALSHQIDQTLRSDKRPLLILKGLPVTADNAATLAIIINSLGDGELLEYRGHSAIVDTIEDKKRGNDPRPRSSNALQFPIHSDLSFCPDPPLFLYFLMVNPSDCGGESLFCDMRAVEKELSADSRNILSLDFPFKAPPHRPEQATLFSRILSYSADGRRLASVRYRRDGLGPLNELQEKAVDELESKIKDRTFEIALKSGEMAIMNNNLIGHGRAEFQDAGDHNANRLAVRTNAGRRAPEKFATTLALPRAKARELGCIV